jgi:hypothetical protein
MSPTPTFALFYVYHPTSEYLMVTVQAPSLAESVFAGRRELRELIGESYRPDNFTLARSFSVPR